MTRALITDESRMGNTMGPVQLGYVMFYFKIFNNFVNILSTNQNA